MDMKRFWQQVRAQVDQISEEWPLVISVEDDVRMIKGGTIVEVSRERAAKLIVEKSHRLCTPEEAEEHRRKEDQLRKIALDEQQARRAISHLLPQMVPAAAAPLPLPTAEAKKQK